MRREYFVSGSSIEIEKDSIVLRGKRSQSGPEIDIRVPVGTFLSLAMLLRRAAAGYEAKTTEQVHPDWKRVHPLPIQVVQIHPTDDQTMGACLLVFDPGTDVELQLSLPTAELVRSLGIALIEAADQHVTAATN